MQNPPPSALVAAAPPAQSFEELVRPLLVMLASAMGMESAYLTSVDTLADQQHVRLAHNTDPAFAVPEGLTVVWSDTLCKRALAEGCRFTDQVAERWGDSDAARALGIRSYASAPIEDEGGQLIGTLCAASPAQRAPAAGAEEVLRLFALLVGQLLQRERLVEQLRGANARLQAFTLSDALTGLPNRRAVVDELQRLLARATRERTAVLVGMVDLDGFKAINDRHGHAVGDAFLQHAAQRLGGALRPSDLLGRIGGDEFVILAPGPALAVRPGPADHSGLADDDGARAAAAALQARCQLASVGPFASGDVAFDYDGASVGIVALEPAGLSVERALVLADAAMYEIKRSRRGPARLEV